MKHGEGQALAREARFETAPTWMHISARRGTGFVVSCALEKRAYWERSKRGAGQALARYARFETAPTWAHISARRQTGPRSTDIQ